MVIHPDPSFRAFVLATLEPVGFTVLHAAALEEAAFLATANENPVGFLLIDLSFPAAAAADLIDTLRIPSPSLVVKRLFVIDDYRAAHAARSFPQAEVSAAPITEKSLLKLLNVRPQPQRKEPALV